MKILYHDREIVIIDKPGGVLSVPGRGPEKQDCIAGRLQALFPEMIGQPAVHRLDMYTSGLMVFAITRIAHRNHEARGIHLSFRLDPDNRPLQIYDPQHGKKGITRWKNMGREEKGTRIEFTPLTGRTHQLRLHSAHPLGLGLPIIGDSLYGTAEEGDKMLLHATSLQFFHPENKKGVKFKSSPPF
ncbi:MAG: RluA family pseudouridine synthase [Deltaproteobacteria bacterium]|nr:RluA family pseudouridine synthase [Deltaproteobacteria bacterium]